MTFFSKLNIPQRQINSLKNGDKWAPKRVIVLLEASFFFKQKHHIRAEDPSSAESSKTHIFFFQKWELVLLFPHHLFLLKGKLWRWHLNSRYRMGFSSIWWKEQVTLISAHWSVQIFEKSKMKKEYCLSLKYGKAVAKILKMHFFYKVFYFLVFCLQHVIDILFVMEKFSRAIWKISRPGKDRRVLLKQKPVWVLLQKNP